MIKKSTVNTHVCVKTCRLAKRENTYMFFDTSKCFYKIIYGQFEIFLDILLY